MKKKISGIIKDTNKFAHGVNTNVKSKLTNVVDEKTTRLGRTVDNIIEILIIFSILVYAIGTLPNLEPHWVNILNVIDIICYSVFTLEYVVRIYISKKPLKYVFSFYGIIDLLAILPFLAGSKFDLRAIRALRIFRIISALKISRYSDAMNRFKTAIKLISAELSMFFIASGIFIFISAAGVFYFEHDAQPEKFASIFHSLWWAIITLTTVGYGDVYPITVGGRIFTFGVLLIGLGVVTIPAGLIASSLTKARQIQDKKKEEKKEENQSDKE